MLQFEHVKHLAAQQPREIIRPKTVVRVDTPVRRQEVIKAAEKVINEHREVLMALKNR